MSAPQETSTVTLPSTRNESSQGRAPLEQELKTAPKHQVLRGCDSEGVCCFYQAEGGREGGHPESVQDIPRRQVLSEKGDLLPPRSKQGKRLPLDQTRVDSSGCFLQG